MSDYTVRLGPLRLRTVLGDLPEALGDKLEAVGAALVAGERGTRPAQLKLPIRGSHGDADEYAAGLRLRRQVRALMENKAWLAGGLYFCGTWDAGSPAWLAIGGGDLTGEGRGITFADWQLALSDAYLVGRPAAVRRGRRLVLVDRAYTAGAASDTRGTLFTGDLLSYAGPPPDPYLPGDIQSVLGFDGRNWASTAGPSVDGRVLYRSGPASTGEVLSWRPSSTVLPDALDRDARAEEPGEVRVWWMPADLPATTPAGDRQPDVAYGWERVLGSLHDDAVQVALENGWCRVIWRGSGLGLQVERWDPAADKFVPICRLAQGLGAAETRIVSVTAERAVVSWLVGGLEMRAILQRGWPGPRVEAYGSPSRPTARLAISGDAAARSTPLTYVDRIATTSGAVLLAKSHAAVTWSDLSVAVPGWSGEWSAPRVLAMQLDAQDGPPARTLAMARYEWRPIPTLTTR